jgi:hypothetical protein
MSNEDLVRRFSAVFPIICHSQAEHCGYHYLTFFADEELLKRLFRASEVSYANAHISVHVHEGRIAYCMTFGPDASYFIEAIEKEFAGH